MNKNRFVPLLKAFLLTGLFIAIISGCSKEFNEMNPVQGEKANSELLSSVTLDGYKIVPNEMLVKFKPGTSPSAKSAALGRVNGAVLENIHTNAMKHFGDNEGIVLVKTPMAVHDAMGRMKNLAEVEFAEPNFIYTTNATSNDPY